MGVKLSAEGKREKEQKLDYLKSIRRKEVAEELKEARSHGDLSENSEYDAAKLAQEQLEIGIAGLEDLLRHAEVIDESKLATDVVALGSVVCFLDVNTGKERTYRISSATEANPRDPVKPSISDQSDIGRGLLGHRVGQDVEITTQSGVKVIRILSINR